MKFNFKFSKKEKVTSLTLWKKSSQGYMNPERDWGIGLFVATLLLVGGLAFIALDFYEQFSTTSTEVVLDEQPILYREKEVSAIAEIYNAKELKFNELRQNKVAPSETSIVEEGGDEDEGVEEVEATEPPTGDPVADF